MVGVYSVLEHNASSGLTGPFPQLIRGDNKKTCSSLSASQTMHESQPKPRLHNVASKLPTLLVDILVPLHRLKGRRSSP